jgi:excisionase family DNA binding protein
VPWQRQWVVRALVAARVRRRWRRAWMDCGLLPVRAGRVRSVPAGELVRVRAARGTSLEALASRAEELAACLGLRELRVDRDPENAATGTVTLVRRDPFAHEAGARWPHAAADRLSLWQPVPVGVDELGQTVSIGLPERNVLLGGGPGAGKSAALSLDPTCELWLLDGKLVELSVWAPCAQRLAGPDVGKAIELLRELRSDLVEARLTLRRAAGEESLLSAAAAAELVGVSADTVRRAIRSGAIEVAGYVGARPRVRRAAVEAWIAAGRRPALPSPAGSSRPGWRPRPRRRLLGDALDGLGERAA